MIKFALVIMVGVSLAITTVGSALSEGPEKIDKVLASGMGTTIDNARKNALRAAVERVVGTYLLSDTIVQNSELINDQILTYSGGYIKESREIWAKRDGDLFVVQIEAVVASSRIRRKLVDLNIAIRKVDGGSLFAEAATKIDEKKDGAALLAKVTAKFPQAAYLFDIGKPVIEKLDEHANKANVKVPVVITWDKKFLDEYMDTIKTIAKAELTEPAIEFSLASKEVGVVCIGGKANIEAVHADRCYRVDSSMYKNLGVKSLIHFIGSGSDLYKKLFLSMKFKKSSGELVARKEYPFSYEQSDRYDWQFGKGDKRDFNNEQTFYHSVPYSFNFPNTLWKAENRVLIVSDGVFKISPTVTIDADKLKDINTIEVSFTQTTSR